ncbi:glycosyltransferase family 4 protein [methanotrophic endosymbiont of Bathymodiolus puteoserpentis (Logatchev)]|jgi:glycosyltransferase involved in cell wall biosynthesis|uniref:glycosyltransferase family 4 protein n=1 Tax=methanotrophic endosymbiont of Bathymodiolus puteoserpentis (Logatchev) TaxID=343235 RepID=UPI0013C761D5|nr:glycosyltransferase family 4 protein [methanotrophic endosymbiont of Bathymodiolus puteoserpentis (Logatchev)]SHE23685.1 Glycosyl transferase, group 1 [methanotrophic endosymbiont of Bathymodiolus puteoserpentis (Logatchev)]
MTLNIGLIGPLPPPYGGMANQANQLYQLLQQEAGIQVSFVQTNAPYANKLIGGMKGVRAIVRLLSYVRRVYRLTGQVDVIHVFANSGWSWQLFSAPVIWIAWLRKTPIIINYRGGEAETYFEKSIKWVRPSMDKATVIVVPSGYLQHVFDKFHFKTQVIPNIINLERFKLVRKESINIKAPHLIITRNLETIYGIATAIKAVAIVNKKFPNFSLSIAGSGPQKNELLELVKKLKLENNIRFTGKLKPDEVATLYQEADIMLNPTTVDNMPNSVLEAMASGVAIVTTNVGGIPYIVEDNKTALFVEVNNAELMAEKIIELLHDKQLYTRLVSNGITEVQQYSWTHIKIQWMNLYQLLGSNKLDISQ